MLSADKAVVVGLEERTFTAPIDCLACEEQLGGLIVFAQGYRQPTHNQWFQALYQSRGAWQQFGEAMKLTCIGHTFQPGTVGDE